MPLVESIGRRKQYTLYTWHEHGLRWLIPINSHNLIAMIARLQQNALFVLKISIISRAECNCPKYYDI